MLPTGHLLGRYRIIRQLGSGGMGTVYEAVHEEHGKRAAIKVIAPDIADSSHWVQRFLNEARALTLIAHPNIVEIYETGTAPDGSPFIVMELLSGPSLDERRKRAGGRLLAAAPRIGRQIALALQAAHDKGIVHRDLKPSNVILLKDEADPEQERVKVLDFGIAKLADQTTVALPGQASRTRTGARMGTPEYMAPEQCVETARVDAKADVYSLGVTLYELCAGQRPFTARFAFELMTQHVRKQPRSLRRMAPEAPAGLVALIHSMLRKQPESRPTMAEVAAQLAEVAAPGRLAKQPQLDGRTPVSSALSGPQVAVVDSAPSLAWWAPSPRWQTRRWRSLRSALLLMVIAGAGAVATLAATAWRPSGLSPARIHTPTTESRSSAPPPLAPPQPLPSPLVVPAPLPIPAMAAARALEQGNAHELDADTTKKNRQPALKKRPGATEPIRVPPRRLFQDLGSIYP